jgi:tetratricopeptide (TPR) repeat protein
VARRLIIGVVVLALVLTAYGSHQRLEAMDGADPDRDRLLYLPSGRLLRVLSLGHPALVADLIYLWSIQFYGYYRGGVRYDYLIQIYDRVITELDPRFRDAYLLGAIILSMEAGRPDDALRLLDKGIAANPEDWILPFEAGFIAYHMKGEFDRATDYFRVSMGRPEAHPVVRRFHAEMYNRSGDKRTSLRHWTEILETAESTYVRQVAEKHVHDLRLEIDLADLEDAVRRFRETAGHLPANLRALLDSGALASLPLDPEGRPYRYDPATGAVSSRARFALQRPTADAGR